MMALPPIPFHSRLEIKLFLKKPTARDEGYKKWNLIMRGIPYEFNSKTSLARIRLDEIGT